VCVRSETFPILAEKPFILHVTQINSLTFMSHKSLTTAVLSVLGEEEENYNSLIIQEIEII